MKTVSTLDDHGRSRGILVIISNFGQQYTYFSIYSIYLTNIIVIFNFKNHPYTYLILLCLTIEKTNEHFKQDDVAPAISNKENKNKVRKPQNDLAVSEDEELRRAIELSK